jgi:nitrite reductase (NO-forming)
MTQFKTKTGPDHGRRNFLQGTAAVLAAPLLAEAATAAEKKVKTADAPADLSKLPRVKQVLVAPPLMPEHEQVAKGGPKIVEITLTIEEKKMVIDDEGTEITARCQAR